MDNTVILLIGGVAIIYLITRADEKKKEDVLQKRAKDVRQDGDINKAIQNNPTDQEEKELELYRSSLGKLSVSLAELGNNLQTNKEKYIRDGVPGDVQSRYYDLNDEFARLAKVYNANNLQRYAKLKNGANLLAKQNAGITTLVAEIARAISQKTQQHIAPSQGSVFPQTNLIDLTAEDNKIRDGFSADGGGGAKRPAPDDDAEVAKSVSNFVDAAEQDRSMQQIEATIEANSVEMGEAAAALGQTGSAKDSAFNTGNAQPSAAEDKASYMAKSGLGGQPPPNTAPKKPSLPAAHPQSFNGAPPPKQTQDNPPALAAQAPPKMLMIRVAGETGALLAGFNATNDPNIDPDSIPEESGMAGNPAPAGTPSAAELEGLLSRALRLKFQRDLAKLTRNISKLAERDPKVKENREAVTAASWRVFYFSKHIWPSYPEALQWATGLNRNSGFSGRDYTYSDEFIQSVKETQLYENYKNNYDAAVGIAERFIADSKRGTKRTQPQTGDTTRQQLVLPGGQKVMATLELEANIPPIGQGYDKPAKRTRADKPVGGGRRK